MRKLPELTLVAIATFVDPIIKNLFRKKEYIVIEEMGEREQKWLESIGKKFVKKVSGVPEGTKTRIHELNQLLAMIGERKNIRARVSQVSKEVTEAAAEFLAKAKAEAEGILEKARQEANEILEEAKLVTSHNVVPVKLCGDGEGECEALDPADDQEVLPEPEVTKGKKKNLSRNK